MTAQWNGVRVSRIIRTSRLLMAGLCFVASATAGATAGAAAGASAAPQADAGGYAAAWGPAVGTRLPLLAAQDHDGRPRDLENLAGRQGLLLFLYRSADW